MFVIISEYKKDGQDMWSIESGDEASTVEEARQERDELKKRLPQHYKLSIWWKAEG